MCKTFVFILLCNIKVKPIVLYVGVIVKCHFLPPPLPLLVRLPNILEYLRDPLQAGLGDRSSYVRKTAVMGVVKLYHVAPEFVEGL